jgi:tetratricopeptide (TPR) repeat protein
MKKIDLPDFQKKQRILYVEHKPDRDLVNYGNRYLEAGRISDAIECYQKVNHVSGLDKIREIAETTGDVMLYQQVLKALNRDASDEDWERIGQRALAQKKYAFSLHAFEKCRDTAMCERVKGMIGSGGHQEF